MPAVGNVTTAEGTLPGLGPLVVHHQPKAELEQDAMSVEVPPATIEVDDALSVQTGVPTTGGGLTVIETGAEGAPAPK